MRVIEAPGMSPIWLRAADYDRICRLQKRLDVSESEVIQYALQCYENVIKIDDNPLDIGTKLDGIRAIYEELEMGGDSNQCHLKTPLSYPRVVYI